jgi:tRNA G18 (ribose-2'-O)-methylase SpoU
MKKLDSAKFIPFSLVAANFMDDKNIGQLIRSAVCFGVETVHIIGYVPPYKELKEKSSTTSNFVKIIQHKTPGEFLKWRREKDPRSELISLELMDEATPLKDKVWNRHIQTYLVCGHETIGVPVEILHHSDEVLYIPMPGPGFCLNTAYTAHIVLYEITR